jgi:anti-anti-sigma regulatory factor
MFRITKIFENSLLAIYKIEGKITDDNLQAWTEELAALQKQADRQLILNFCQVWSISAKAIEILMAHLTNDVRVMNPSMDVRNMLHAAGLAAKVLE